MQEVATPVRASAIGVPHNLASNPSLGKHVVGVHHGPGVAGMDWVASVRGVSVSGEVPVFVDHDGAELRPWQVLADDDAAVLGVRFGGHVVFDGPPVQTDALGAGLVPHDRGDLFGSVDAPSGLGSGGRNERQGEQQNDHAPHVSDDTPI